MSTTPKNHIVIVCRNNIHLSMPAIKSALAQDMPVQVTAIDNQSIDGTGAWLTYRSSTDPKLDTFKFTPQVALSQCWNFILKALFLRTGNNADRALIINNDIELRPDTFRTLAAMDAPFVTAVSVNNKSQLGTPRPELIAFSQDDIDQLKANARPHPDFSCFMISRACYERVGEFDANYYPAYYEDNDYHVRMHRAGIKAMCIDLPFLHHGAQTVKNANPAESFELNKRIAENRVRFFKKYRCYPGTPDYDKLFQ